MAEVRVDYRLETERAKQELEGLKTKIRETSAVSEKAVKQEASASSKRAKLLKEEMQDLRELESRRAKAYKVKEISDYNARINETKKRIALLKGEYSGLDRQNNTLMSSFKRLGAAIGLTFAVRGLASFAQASAEMYDKQVKAEAQLLRALGGREDVQQRLLQQAKDLQGVTLFGDEQTMEVQASIAAFVKDEQAIKSLTEATLDFATAMNLDARTAGQLLTKTVASGTNALSRYGIVVEGTVGSNERLESVLKGVQGAFGGAAKTAAEAGTGGITQLENKIGDLKEEIGKEMVPILLKWKQAQFGLVKGVKEAVKFIIDNRKVIITLVGAVVAYSAAVAIARARTLALNIAMKLNPWGLAAAGIVAAVLALKQWTGRMSTAEKRTKILADAQKEMTKQFAKESSELTILVDKIKKSEIGTTERKEAVRKLNEQYGDLLGYEIDEKVKIDDLSTAYTTLLAKMKERIASDVVRMKQTEILQLQIDKESEATDFLTKKFSEYSDEITQIIPKLNEVQSVSDAMSVSDRATAEAIAKKKGVTMDMVDAYRKLEGQTVKVGAVSVKVTDIFSGLTGQGHETRKAIEQLGKQAQAYVAGGGGVVTVTEDMTEANTDAAAAEDERVQAIKGIVDGLDKQLLALKMAGDELTIYQLKQLGATDAQIEAVKAMQDEINAINELQTKEKERAAAASAIRERQKTEHQKYQEEIGKLNDLLDSNAITEAEYTAEIIALSQKRAEARNKETQSEVTNIEDIIARREELLDMFVRSAQEIMAANHKAFAEQAKAILDMGEMTQEQYDAIIDGMEQRMKEFSRSTTAEVLQVGAQIAGAMRELLTQMAGASVKNAEFLKLLAYAEILFNTAIAVSNAVASAKGATGVDLVIQIGLAIAAVLAGIAQAKAFANQAKIPTAPKFAEGGWIKGKPHSRGGVLIEAEDEEFVTKKKYARQYSEVLEAMNSGQYDKFVVKNYVAPLVAAQERRVKREQSGFAENVARSLGVAMDSRVESYLAKLVKKSGHIENFDELARLLNKGGKGWGVFR